MEKLILAIKIIRAGLQESSDRQSENFFSVPAEKQIKRRIFQHIKRYSRKSKAKLSFTEIKEK